MAYFPAPGTNKSVKSPVSEHRTEPKKTRTTTQIGIDRLGHVEKVKLYLFLFPSIKTPGSTILFSSAIVICCEKWPFNKHQFMYKSTLCCALTNLKSLKLGKNYTDFGIT